MRDREIVDLLDRTGGLDVASLRCVLGLGQTVAYRRLGRLEEHGMVSAERPFQGTPGLYIPTRRGLRDVLGRSDLEPPSVSMSSYNHQVQVGRVLSQLDRADVPWEASRVTRRHQRAAIADGDLVEARRYALTLSWLERSHLPDALIWPSQTALSTEQPVAIEVELTQKSGRRLDEILNGYAAHLGFCGVVYLCAEATLEVIKRAVDRGQHQSVVNVSPLAEFGPGVEATADAGDQTSWEHWIGRYLDSGEPSAIERYFRSASPAAEPLTLPGI